MRRTPAEMRLLRERIDQALDELMEDFDVCYRMGYSQSRGLSVGRSTGPADPTGSVVASKGRYRGACAKAGRLMQTALEKLTYEERRSRGEVVVVPGASAVLASVLGKDQAMVTETPSGPATIVPDEHKESLKKQAGREFPGYPWESPWGDT